ncbi:putative c6 finger domain-containing protein [Daldinia childiae]|uniref:putative c6 finger domain-containing protein n=1 Tax=Daldinia childiae TaxID=326645 RepID=UPI0014486849|nr:putative c6 finger domain-containing protein [Daldinia childiae]KAF3066561.1 putative c6 finger domain-containing protein [Daldinia childiae]
MATMETMTTAEAVGSAMECAPKHRACDECRTRKLACTKEPEGCSRCKREGIACHYSPQKQMGRPRKRPRDESSNDTANAVSASKNAMTEIPPDTEDLGLSFINFLAAGEPNVNNLNAPISSPQEKGFSWSFGLCSYAALYLSLDSMQKQPEGVEESIRHARKATRTAYDAVYCPVCSFRLEPPDHNSGPDIMRSFQNLMLLAALVPSIVHAYQRILQAVDEEASRATAERRRLIFRLRGFGGILWGYGSGEEENMCMAAGSLDCREMEPAMWRLTVRALLKADVYGLSDVDTTEAETLPIHIGLKDIVNQMEQKSRARHALMDALIATGNWQPPDCGIALHTQGEIPTCQKVIAIAKAAIDALVIA